MLEDNRILPFIFTFLPALIYAVVIYLRSPKRSISRRMSQLYFHMGMVSAIITLMFLWVFPNWSKSLCDNQTLSIFLHAFFQIALLEEGLKFLMFNATERYRRKRTKPVAIMFYCMCVSAGFAVLENVMYLKIYGIAVLAPRAFSAILLHMITGLLMGYFMTLASVHSDRRHTMKFVALIVATVYHGLYDFNIMISGKNIGIPITLVSGIIVTYLMWRHLVNISQPNNK